MANAARRRRISGNGVPICCAYADEVYPDIAVVGGGLPSLLLVWRATTLGLSGNGSSAF